MDWKITTQKDDVQNKQGKKRKKKITQAATAGPFMAV